MSFRPYFFTFNVWFSYTISMVATLFFMVFELPELYKELGNITEPIFYLFVAGLLLAMVGTLLSLLKPKYGAIAMIAGALAMVAYHLLLTPPLVKLAIVYGFPYLIPGFFLLLPKRKELK